MAGIKNQVLFGDNVDFTGNTIPQGQVTTNGQLLIGSTVAPNIRVGSLTSSDNSSTIVTGAGTIDIQGAPVGSFTPVIQGATTPGTATYNTQSGRYIKIGKLVYVIVNLVWTGHTGTGNMQLAGLPFIFAQALNHYPSPVLCQNILFPVGSTYIMADGINNTTIANFIGVTTNAAFSNVQVSAAGEIDIQLVYFTD